MRKRCYLLVILFLCITSPSSYGFNDIKISDLPWEQFKFTNLPLHIITDFIFTSLLAVFLIFPALYSKRRSGKKIMSMSTREPNYPFWFVLIFWIGSMLLAYNGIGKKLELVIGASIPEEMKSHLIMLDVVYKVGILITVTVVGIGLLIHVYGNPEIRENGIRKGGKLISWESITMAEWEKPGEMTIHYTNRKFFNKLMKAAYYLELKPETQAEVDECLKIYIPEHKWSN